MKTEKISVKIRDKRNPMARELSSPLYRHRIVEAKKIKARETRSKGSLRRQLIAADHLLSGFPLSTNLEGYRA